LSGDQSGDRGQHRVQVLASAEVPRQGAPVLQVADAVLHADPRRRMSPAFGFVRRGDGGEDRDLVLRVIVATVPKWAGQSHSTAARP
jgi:hypothetical protein